MSDIGKKIKTIRIEPQEFPEPAELPEPVETPVHVPA